MIDHDKKNNALIPVGSTDLVRVEKSISITNKILYGGITELFNTAFCKLNSKQNLRTDIDYLFLLETNPSERKKSKYHYVANKEDDYKEALEKFNSILKIKHNHLLSIYMGAICKTRLGLTNYLDEALEDFSKVIEIEPKDADAYYFRGDAKYHLVDYEGAIEDYSKVIEIDPKYADAYYSRGMAKDELEDYDGAIEDYSKAIEIDPKDASAYYFRGGAKESLNDYKGAIEDYSRAIEIDPEHADAYYSRGDTKYDLKDYEGAIEDYSKVIEIDPINFLAYIKRGEAKERIGDIEGAKQDKNFDDKPQNN